MRTNLLGVSASLGLCLTVVAQAPMDDALWIAARGARNLTKISRCGEVLQTVDLSGNVFSLRGMHRAPDGKLWIVNFITATITILDRNGGSLLNVPTTGTAFAMAFDRSGNAWVTMSNLGQVHQFTPAGVFIQSITLGAANPLGITIDSNGNIWCAHRNTTPAVGLSRIDAVTNAVTTFPIATPTTMQPTAVVADYQGFGNPSHIWVVGDGSNQLAEFDNTGTQLNTYLLGTGSGLSAVAIDSANHIWVSNFSNGQVYKVDSTNGAVLLNFLSTPTAIGMTMDAMGHPWVLNRLATTAELRRFDPIAGTLEVVAQVGAGAQSAVDSSGFQYAFVVDQLGDADGDGDANFAEVLAGTSPYDAQSNGRASLDAIGSTQLGATCQLTASGGAGVMVALIGRGTIPGLPVPGVTGLLQLDPLGVLATVLPFPTPGALPLTIPTDPTLNGAVVFFQGIHASTSLLFTNTACVLLHQ